MSHQGLDGLLGRRREGSVLGSPSSSPPYWIMILLVSLLSTLNTGVDAWRLRSYPTRAVGYGVSLGRGPCSPATSSWSLSSSSAWRRLARLLGNRHQQQDEDEGGAGSGGAAGAAWQQLVQQQGGHYREGRLEELSWRMKQCYAKLVQCSNDLLEEGAPCWVDGEGDDTDHVVGFVRSATKAFSEGYSRGEVERHLWALDALGAGAGLTSSDKATRSHWLHAVQLTMHTMEALPVVGGERADTTPTTPEDFRLKSQVRLVVNGHLLIEADESSHNKRRGGHSSLLMSDKLDDRMITRSLRAMSGAGHRALPLQLVPVTRVVLLTLQTLLDLDLLLTLAPQAPTTATARRQRSSSAQRIMTTAPASPSKNLLARLTSHLLLSSSKSLRALLSPLRPSTSTTAPSPSSSSSPLPLLQLPSPRLLGQLVMGVLANLKDIILLNTRRQQQQQAATA